jgi:mono/diheme cytochrome c family protein
MLRSIQHNLKKIAVLSCFFTATTIISCRFYYNTTKDDLTVPAANTAVVQRGKNLTHNVCGSCHYDHTIKRFIGKPLNDLPKIGGKLYAANLTHSITNGIPPKYSDAELFYLIKTGIAKNGKYMPYMMKPMMADEDIDAIISYLRSDDEDVAAADTTIGISHINLLGRTGIRIVSGKPQQYTKGIARPDENDPVAYGYYLVSVMSCYHCHSKKILGLDFLHPEKSTGFMAGGIRLKDKENKRIFSANITPDNETGIGSYTLTDFSKAVKDGITPTGRELKVPMPKFKQLTDKQVNAIYAYIRTLAAVHHKVKRV